MISAKVICDSVSNQEGHRITTFELRYPKFIHGEAKTHRIIRVGNEGGFELIQEVGFMGDENLSRNASSSRAIPTAKLLEEVRSPELRAGPVFWGKNQPGMQAAVELDDENRIGPEIVNQIGYLNLTVGLVSKDDGQLYDCPITDVTEKTMANILWNDAAMEAADIAEKMLKLGVHKQIVNRILEPFTHINVVCTATEYDNFFGLRLHADAQPEARALAIAMWEARKASTPQVLQPGWWHLPYVPVDDGCGNAIAWDERIDDIETVRKVSVARCARVSYRSFETGRESTMEEDLKLFDRLVGAQPLHASPAEHQATPDYKAAAGGHGRTEYMGWKHKKEHGNFVGWRQYRKMLPNEECAPLPEGF